MFTRSSSTEVHSLEPPRTTGSGSGNAQQQPRQRPLQAGAKSVIGNDLKIISQGTLQVDGEIEGDVGGAEVIIGELGRVTGTVAAERVIVRGTISGVIRGATVTLKSTFITYHSPSSRAPSSMADAGEPQTLPHLGLIWALRPSASKN